MMTHIIWWSIFNLLLVSDGFHLKFTPHGHGEASNSQIGMLNDFDRNGAGRRVLPKVSLKSPRITNWGDWGNASFCPPFAYATGIRVKYEPVQFGGADDTAINGLGFNCLNVPNNQIVDDNPSSLVGGLGRWAECNCPVEGDLVFGVEICTQSPRNDVDNVAAVGFSIICKKTGLHVCVDGMRRGVVCAEARCPDEYHAVCGIKTQVDVDQLTEDNTGLNNVDFTCCNWWGEG